jgi:integrase
MSDEIKVSVLVRHGKYYLRYFSPETGKPVENVAKEKTRSNAEKAAGKLQAELQEGRYAKPSKMSWETFREYYTANAMPALKESSIVTYEGTLNVFESCCNPKKLSDVTTTRVTAFVTSLRTEGRSEDTVACHLRHLKAAMRWAHKEGLLATLPKFTMPKRLKGAKVMRGRPITGEEFDRMIEAVPRIVENAAAKSWEFYLRGLWASGLRLSESLLLRWDDAPGALVVDFSYKRPMFRIPGESQKSGRDTLLPMVPEFATLLQSVPESERKGRVFKLLAADGTQLEVNKSIVGKTVSKIGKAAGVVVDRREKLVADPDDKDQEKARKQHRKLKSKSRKVTAIVEKFASAHDLRRAFGFRWAMKVMPVVLKELMRHADIGTTMKYYVGQNAEATAEAVWAALDSPVPASARS